MPQARWWRQQAVPAWVVRSRTRERHAPGAYTASQQEGRRGRQRRGTGELPAPRDNDIHRPHQHQATEGGVVRQERQVA